MRTSIALALVLAAGCTPSTMARALRYGATGTEIAAQGALACDWGSTRTAVPLGYVEQNPIMGTHPDGPTIAGYFATSSALVVAYNRVLPDVLRIIANVGVAGAEIAAVQGNDAVGVSTCGI